MRLFDLSGSTALVTGARSGIGRAIAVGLAEAGADVVLHGHSDNLSDAEEAIRASGRTARRWVRDLSRLDGLADEAAALAGETPIDILVNNAGIIRRAPALSASDADWRDVLTVNLEAPYVLSRALGGPMVERGRGKVVNIASLLSFQGGLNVVGYTASKHAIVGMTRALSNEWAPYGVQVNALAPGYIATDNTAPLRADPDREPQIRGRIPAGRWGTTGDLVGAAIFLASAASDYVTGQVLAVDGGWLAR
jgi:2-dehydro-3-deoxy-D-gluconate 5-dehydrogenase